MHKNRSQLNFSYDVLEQVEKIKIRLKDLSMDEFKKNEDLQLAIERRLEIIGEAVSNIEIEVLLKVKEDRAYWRIIKDMRNRITHEYWGVSLEVVYKTGKERMDELEAHIKQVIEILEKNEV